MDGIYQTAFEQNIAPFFFENTSDETVPPYAAMIIEEIVIDERRGGLLAKIRKCTEEDEKAQNHRMILFNGHRPVPTEKRGRGTTTLPTNVLIGGPTLSASGDGDAEPTTGVMEPERLDCVGPVRDSWELWYGGVTHTIEFIKITGTQRLATVTVNTCPGAIVRFFEDIDAASGNTPAIGTVYLQVRDRSTGERENAMANGNQIELEVEHDGADIDGDDKLGQAKMSSGKWTVDVKYCE